MRKERVRIGRVYEDGDVLRLVAADELDIGMLDYTMVPVHCDEAEFLFNERLAARICLASDASALMQEGLMSANDYEDELQGEYQAPPTYRQPRIEPPITGRVVSAERVASNFEDGTPRRRERVRIVVEPGSAAQIGIAFWIAIEDSRVQGETQRFVVESIDTDGVCVLATDYDDRVPLPRVGAIASTSSR